MSIRINADAVEFDVPPMDIKSMTVKEHRNAFGQVYFRELVGVEISTITPIIKMTWLQEVT
jgi:hypothetical protein